MDVGTLGVFMFDVNRTPSFEEEGWTAAAASKAQRGTLLWRLCRSGGIGVVLV